jgi:dTDP-4-amino-4,6-dideoxygalactose transaminase
LTELQWNRLRESQETRPEQPAVRSTIGDYRKTVETMLAIFGNQPRFKNDLHVGRPNIGSKTRLFSLIEDCLERKWLTNDGVLVKQFEKMICEMTGARHCIAVCNATIGLELVVRALGGDGEVIVPAFTFVATPNAVGMVNGHATFCDVDESI